MLPLVRKIAEEMITLSRSIDAQSEQLRGVEHLPERSGQVEYQEELDDIRLSLEKDEKRLQQCVSELIALGVEPHVPIDGSVDPRHQHSYLFRSRSARNHCRYYRPLSSE